MKKLTQEEFEERVYAHNDLVTVVGQYQKYGVDVECRCNFCGATLWMDPSNLIAGKGCYSCSKQRVADSQRKTTDQFIEELRNKQPNISVIGSYIGSRRKIRCRCVIHDCTFEATPTHLLNGETGCSFCIAEKLHANNALTNDEFVFRLLVANPDVELLDTYYNQNTPVHVRCRQCGFEWSALPCTLQIAHGCRKCYRSVGEAIIQDWLDQHGVAYECQKKYPDELRGLHGRVPLSYDFYLPTCNTLIEYQGEFHDGTAYGGQLGERQLRRQQDNDAKKRQYAAEKGIHLLEIWYYQRDQIPNILFDLVKKRNEPVTTTAA